MNSAKRVLPADVYDALELSAWVHGGIGAGRWYEGRDDRPVCATGHGAFLAGDCMDDYNELKAFSFDSASINPSTNDTAVQAINARHGAPLNARVPFNKWCSELNVVRGK